MFERFTRRAGVDRDSVRAMFESLSVTMFKPVPHRAVVVDSVAVRTMFESLSA